MKGERESPTSDRSPRARDVRACFVFLFSISLSLRDSPRGVFVTNFNPVKQTRDPIAKLCKTKRKLERDP